MKNYAIWLSEDKCSYWDFLIKELSCSIECVIAILRVILKKDQLMEVALKSQSIFIYKSFVCT